MTRTAAALLLLLTAGTSGCASYRASPVDPAAHLRAYRARGLDDSALAAWVARYAGRPDGRRWNAAQLAVAALALRAEIEAARRTWLTAGAGVRSAGMRPPPGAAAEVERAVSGAGDASPWVVSLTGLFTLELGGKRGARLQAARARQAVAESELLLVSQATRERVRLAATEVVHAEEAAADARSALNGLESVAALERGRFQEAALASSELARTAADVAEAGSRLAAAERDAGAARAALAGLLAVTPPATRSLLIDAGMSGGCAWADSLGADSLLGLAARRRPEIARALGSYAAAESDVRLQVARQRPDLELGPGFIWDQGVHRWTLAVALPALLGVRNRAPIEEAEAARAAAAARVYQAQEAVLAQAGQAVEACVQATRERGLADSVAAAAANAAEVARARYDRGESGRLEVARAELALVRAAAVRSAADRWVARAGLAVESAAGEWRDRGVSGWPDPRRAPEIGQEGE